MTDPRRVADVEHSENVERAIAACWDQLAMLEEAGTLPPNRLDHLARREPPDNAHPLVRSLWLGVLRRAVDRPGEIGMDIDAFDAGRCRCDGGWVDEHDEQGHKTGVRPCEQCEPRLYHRWRDHWRDRDHICAECAPRRGTARRAKQTDTVDPPFDRGDDSEPIADSYLDELR